MELGFFAASPCRRWPWPCSLTAFCPQRFRAAAAGAGSAGADIASTRAARGSATPGAGREPAEPWRRNASRFADCGSDAGGRG